jgi:short-subunit dehydrogenase
MSVKASSSSEKGTAVITGASSGIGKVYADRLAKRGYNLLLIARRGDRSMELAQRLRNDQGVSAQTLVADLGNPTDLKKVANIIATDSRITMLVNNAGTSKMAPSIKVPLEEVDRQLDVNARALTHLSLAVSWKRLGNKRTTNLPMMPERINHAAESPTVFLPYRDDL